MNREVGGGIAPDELLSNEPESVSLCRSEPSGVTSLCNVVVVTPVAFVFSLLCCSASRFTSVTAEVSFVVSVGVADPEIHMPSTWTPLWIARTPKGMVLAAARLDEVGRSPVLRMSSIRAFFSSSRISCFRTIRFVHHSLTRPAQKTAAIATASALN